ncbi:MAG: amino acid adenylation domain-containing protein [Acidobacteria bacterium]|nr:amino acid adenylation domain-containing protein [Acidobacteriota bacterium]
MKKNTTPSPTGGAGSPMSLQQQRLWVLNQIEQHRSALHTSICMRLRGKLDRSLFKNKFVSLVGRHRILSSRFVAVDGRLLEVPGTPTAEILTFNDLGVVPKAEREDKAESLLQQERKRPFCLEVAPAVRATLLRMGHHDHILLLMAHQVACDEMSLKILLNEIAQDYSGMAKLHAESEVEYEQYAAWQNEYLESESARTDLNFWKQQLEGVTAGIELPTDSVRPSQPSFRGKRQTLRLPSALLTRIELLARQEQTSSTLLLLAAFVALLYRYTGGEDIVLGTEVTGRNFRGTEKAIGPFLNDVVLRVNAGGNPGVRELLKRVHEAWKSAQDHHLLPFAKLLDVLDVDRDFSRNPVFQVKFAPDLVPEVPVFRGLDVTMLPVQAETETLDLTLRVREKANATELVLSYSADLFSDASIERMVSHYQTILESFVADANQKLSSISMLSSAERRLLLVDWNSTAVAYPLNKPLHCFIEDQVARSPQALALIFEDQRLTYAELNARANQLGHRLQKLGVGPDVFVGVCAERSLEMVIALLAVLKAGGAYVPLDPEYPQDRLEGMISDINPPIILTQSWLLDRVPAHAPVICLDRDWNLIAQENVANCSVELTGKNLAYVIYTSGSTGKPKGVANVHEGIVNRLLWMQDAYQLTAADRVLQKTPYSFDVSVWEFFWPMMTGAALVIARPEGHKDPSYLRQLISDQRITTVHFVPSMLSIFLETTALERTRSLKRVFASGEALTIELQQRFFERVPGAELHNLYGPTEAAVDVTYWKCRPERARATVPIGRAIANIQIYILDAHLQPVPIGVSGELHIGGIGLARGYLNRPDLTQEKFIPNPFGRPGERLYKTGDLARFLPDGNIEYLGRTDHQVKLRGFRIELGEIESVLQQCPEVQQAVVTLREDHAGDKRLVAYVKPAQGQVPDSNKLRAHLQSRVPDYMIPAAFLVMEEFPMTTSGKVNRRALPEPQLPSSNGMHIAPRTETERLVVRAFETILHLPSVSVCDDFFELGGHSLLAAQLLTSIERESGRHIPLRLLFQGATPEYLAHALEYGIDLPPEPTVTLINAGGSGAPFFAVVPPGENAVGYMKLSRNLGSEQSFYKLQGAGPIVEGRPYTWDEMKGLAADYVTAMRSVQPEGPYFFGGMCDGAHLAIRMAERIEQLGQTVGMLAVFDTWVLENSQRRWAWRLHYYSERFGELAKHPFSEWLRVAARVAERTANRFRAKPPSATAWGEAYWPGRGYKPPTFNGRVALFKRPKQPFYYKPDPAMGWSERARAGVDIHVLPIHHGQMLREPSVQLLAESLAQALRQAQTSDREGSLAVEPGVKISLSSGSPREAV